MSTYNTPAYKFTISVQYFLYFGILGIFLPYFNLYCYRLGFTGFEIGILSSVRTVSTLIFPSIWITFADHFKQRRRIYILCNFISAFIWILYLFFLDFHSMLVITVIYSIFYSPLISFLESFTMDVLSHEKKKYGRIRAWGSLSFISMALILGELIHVFDIKIILSLILVGSFIQSIACFGMPAVIVEKKDSIRHHIKHFTSFRILIFLFCAFLMLVSHGTYYGFFSIHLANLGYNSFFIGIAWVLASGCEILVMVKSDWILRRFPVEKILTFTFLVAALRWFCVAYAITPLSILLTQILHAITYGAFHITSIIYIDRLSPKSAKSLGQAINNGVTYGLGMLIGFLLNGYFYERIGMVNLFIISSLISLFAGIVFWLFSTQTQPFSES